jgi:hypothetical protein
MNTMVMMFSAIAILPTLITGQIPFTLKVLQHQQNCGS